MNQPVIRYVFPTMNLGGAEKHVISLASGLRERGFDTGIVTLFEEGALADSIRENGLPFVCLRQKSGWGPATFFRISRWIRSARPDVLHTYLFGFHFFVGLPARVLKVPILISSRRELAQWKKRRHRWLENWGNRFVDRVVCCSEAAKKWTVQNEQIDPDKVLTLHNGVDLRQFDGAVRESKIRLEFRIPIGAPLIGTVANFSYEKGYPYLLEAVRRIHERRPDAWFLFVGSGRFEQEIKAQAQAGSVGKRIIFAGQRPDIPEILRGLDIFVLASLIEGFPNVLLEAMAMAKPVVATAVGGIPELITSDKEGLLVPARDGKSLAEAILGLLGNPEKASRLGQEALQKIKNRFSIERMVDDYDKLYRTLREEKITSRNKARNSMVEICAE
ncbi:MAG: glycosyltransferase [Candidatus Omnitrophica bacterium]|nr:glycosyltransferase [Candidatus Omnitrophota bacterium]